MKKVLRKSRLERQMQFKVEVETVMKKMWAWDCSWSVPWSRRSYIWEISFLVCIVDCGKNWLSTMWNDRFSHRIFIVILPPGFRKSARDSSVRRGESEQNHQEHQGLGAAAVQQCECRTLSSCVWGDIFAGNRKARAIRAFAPWTVFKSFMPHI